MDWFGRPKQEKFMKLLLPKIKTGIMIGVGAAFDFYNPKVELEELQDFLDI